MKLFSHGMFYAFMLTLTGSAMAEPGLINYQGRLTDATGEPITTAFDITFTFWDAETDGTQLGSGFSDLDTVTPDANGIYATFIGDDPDNPVPESIFASDGIWLNVRINGEDLSPRKRIVSVGYAMRSAQADEATTASRSLVANQADNANKLDGQPLSALAAVSHEHSAEDITSGLFTDAMVADILSISSLGAVDGGAIKSGLVAASRIDSAIARDSEILPAVLAGDGPGSGLDADMLDGQDSSLFALDAEVFTLVLASDGSGSGLDADRLDGLHASAFMSAASDNWVNTTGDTMTGALIVTGSATNLVDIQNNGAGDVAAIRGRATGTGAVSNYGGYFEAASETGRGVYGLASRAGTDVLNHGGYFEAAGEEGHGVTGIATGFAGRGVYGSATATNDGGNYGGYFESAGEGGRGAYGRATGYRGVGLQGYSNGIDGTGVYGSAMATGNTPNTGGEFKAFGDLGTGVSGTASATGATTNYGGYFKAAGDSGRGVYGSADATGATTNYGGYFLASGSFGRGVFGSASGGSGRGVYGKASATGYVTNYGGYFESAGNYGRGVYGNATGTEALGVYGTASGTNGKGVYGVGSAAGAVTNYGGYFSAAGNSGRAVYGIATATDGASNYGGRFEAKGVSGTGVYGAASAYGGFFQADGPRGRGIEGQATGSEGCGVYGYASDPTAFLESNYGGYFEAYGRRSQGVYGTASGTNGKGVYGYASTTGLATNYGGYFETRGDAGVGVKGYAAARGAVTNYGGSFEALGDYSTGVRGEGKAYDFYAAGTGTNYGPFTGAHEVQFTTDFPVKSSSGLIVVTAGPSKIRQDENNQVSISSTMPTVRLADQPNDKAVFGVLLRELPLPEDHWYKPTVGERFGVVNALGEGRVWVCTATGPIEMGDYITTSAVPGYGQRQNDDLQHSYTVGKVIESVDWDAVTDTIEQDGQVYKVYLIAVVYMCG